MSTLFLSHDHCQRHSMGERHPESPDRLAVIEQLIKATDWQGQIRFAQAPLIELEILASAHPQEYVDRIVSMSPQEGFAFIDGDTSMNPHSLEAARRAAGAAALATREVINGNAQNAFCSVRPPGHHAESSVSMGFCLFNSVAVAAELALACGMERVAILDFDVHHGNGTVEIFQDRPEVLVCSSFQYPFYPGRFDRVERPNICLTPLAAGSGSAEFQAAIDGQWIGEIRRHQPEMIFVSAGFDAHRDDPLGGLNLCDDDFYWVTCLIRDLAEELAGGKIVSLLEGGYDLSALARSVKAHLNGLVSQPVN